MNSKTGISVNSMTFFLKASYLIFVVMRVGLNWDQNCIHISSVLLTTEMMTRMLSRKTYRWVLRHNAHYHVNFIMLFLHILQNIDSVIISDLIV